MRKLLLFIGLFIFSVNAAFSENKSANDEATPVITASAMELTFWNSWDHQSLDVYGENLIDDIDCVLGGDDASSFSIGRGVWNNDQRVLYIFPPSGDRVYKATLTLSSKGAEDVVIRLIRAISSIDTSRIYFGQVSVGTSSGAKVIKTLGIDLTKENAFRFEPPYDEDSFDIVYTHYDPETLEGEFHVVFSPKRTEPYYVDLYLKGGGGNDYYLSMHGNGMPAYSGDSPYIEILPKYIGTLESDIGETITERFRVEKYNLTEDISYEIIADNPDSYSITIEEDDPNGVFTTYIVSFTPSKVGGCDAEVVFSSRGAENQTLTVLGYGNAYLSVDPYELDFGEVAVPHESKTLAVTVTGIIDTKIDYNFNYNDQGFTIDESEWDPATGGTLYVTFKPTELIYYSGSIVFMTGNTSKMVSLNGIGAELPGYPRISVDPINMEFINPHIESESEPQIITITGEDLSEPLQYEFIDMENASDFRIEEVSWDSMKGGILSVTYTPSKRVKEDTAIESAKASLTFSSPNALKKETTLTGSPITVFNTPNSLLFGNVPIGTTSNPQSIYVSGINLESHKQYNIDGQDKNYFDVNITFNPDTYISKIDVAFSPTETDERSYRAQFYFSYDYYYRYISFEGYGIKNYNSIEAIEDNKGILVYPNPATEAITIETEGLNLGDTIEVYSINGTKMITSRVEGITTTMDVSSLPAGVYIVRLNGVNQKFVKL